MIIQLTLVLLLAIKAMISLIVVLSVYLNGDAVGGVFIWCATYLLILGLIVVCSILLNFLNNQKLKLHRSRAHQDLLLQMKDELPRHLVKTYMANPGTSLEVGLFSGGVRVASVSADKQRNYEIEIDEITESHVLNAVRSAKGTHFNRPQKWLHSRMGFWVTLPSMSNHQLVRHLETTT